MNKTLIAAISLAAALGTTTADASLLSRLGGKAYYDDVANLTWLQDANAAAGTIYHDTAAVPEQYVASLIAGQDYVYLPGPTTPTDGYISWDNTMIWAQNLNVDGVTGWRLPGGPSVNGYNQTGSDIGNFWYNVLGGQPLQRISVVHNANYDLFKNIHSNLALSVYWSSERAWGFGFDGGHQGHLTSNHFEFAWAVHDGDVGASPVPLPTAACLLAPVLAGLGLARRRAI